MLNDAAETTFKKVFIACGRTDLRYGITGLASLICSINSSKNVRIKNYLNPQIRAISASSSGHSCFSSLLEITRLPPWFIASFFCSREGNA